MSQTELKDRYRAIWNTTSQSGLDSVPKLFIFKVTVKNFQVLPFSFGSGWAPGPAFGSAHSRTYERFAFGLSTKIHRSPLCGVAETTLRPDVCTSVGALEP